MLVHSFALLHFFIEVYIPDYGYSKTFLDFTFLNILPNSRMNVEQGTKVGTPSEAQHFLGSLKLLRLHYFNQRSSGNTNGRNKISHTY